MNDKFVNVELFSLTYGSLVRAIVKETNNIDDANAKLMKIGVSLGNRITDDIVVHQDPYNIKTFRQAYDLVVASFKNYLGVVAQPIDPTDNRVVLHLSDGPITRYVTIPLENEGLIYLNPLLGAIKTMLSMLHFSTEVKLIKDRLRGDSANEIEIKLIDIMNDTLPPGEYLS
ncbi:Trafficking protein particle complex subunit 3 [Tritrichomonas musculus]|uniref:Trafficking protein particle complex subunit 3 n=1 Tax=Tritrichomonas musculus TaxID=1915356 RepID=A0ABR2K1F4_9EUKA